tara:strand:+ start:6422 stop:7501 length:1080 start_codon:yes stop_codon:yes gene_type:complete
VNNSLVAKKIIMVDMDAFYVSVEERENPELRGKPVAVGGVTSRAGIIAASNYEAREFGVKSAMNTAYARKLCPGLVVLPSNIKLYEDVSRQIHQIFHRYSDTWEPVALDEAWGDLTNATSHRGSASLIAKAIRSDIYNETGLTASAGVAPNKFLAKLACSENKPNGFYCIRPEDVESYVATLELSKISGVGRNTLQVLHDHNLYTTADIRATDKAVLKDILGQFGEVLLQRSYGIDNSPIVPFREPKSVGISKTIPCDIYSPEEAQVFIYQLYDELVARVLKQNAAAKVSKIAVRLRFNDFVSTSMETSDLVFDLPSYRELFELVWRRSRGRGVRLVGMSVKLSDGVSEAKKSQYTLPF